MVKAVILLGGPQKGTRFRPLSFNSPKPLFPIGGLPMLEHLIRACVEVGNLQEILLIGFYQLDDTLARCISEMSTSYAVAIRYLQEYTPLGTAGGIYHFRDTIRLGDPEAVFLLNGDLCGSLDLSAMLDLHRRMPAGRMVTIMATEATRQQSLDYGCIVESPSSHEMLHYVEKPSSFVSTTISCGVYLFSPNLLDYLAKLYRQRAALANVNPSSNTTSTTTTTTTTTTVSVDLFSLETDVLPKLAGLPEKPCYVFRQVSNGFWWCPIKTPGSAIYANRYCLASYRTTKAELLSSNSADGPTILGDVYIHPTAVVDPTATLGPNVSILEGVRIGAGVRVKESIILKNVSIGAHSVVLYSILGWSCNVGSWSRVEGTACDPNPDRAYAKLDNRPLFDVEGRLNPLITVLGCNVQVASEIIVRNAVVLPYKELTRSYKNEIIL